MTDPIADMLTRIRNAQAVKKAAVFLPMSNLKYAIAQILKHEGWIYDLEVVEDKFKKKYNTTGREFKIVLKYKKSGRPAIASLKRVSKPGLRVYVDKDHLPKVLNNMGIAIISTSQGLMTNKEAKRQGLGGEVICEIY